MKVSSVCAATRRRPSAVTGGSAGCRSTWPSWMRATADGSKPGVHGTLYRGERDVKRGKDGSGMVKVGGCGAVGDVANRRPLLDQRGLTACADCSPALTLRRALQLGDVELLHLQQRLHTALTSSHRIGHQLRQHRRDDLPGEPYLSLSQPHCCAFSSPPFVEHPSSSRSPPASRK